MKYFIYLSFLTLILSACGSIQPVAPEVIVQEDYKVSESPASMIKIPIKVNLKPYFDQTDAELDKVFRGNEQQCDGVSFKYKFVRSPIEFKGIGDKLLFDVDGKYSLWINYCAACSDLFASDPYCITPRIYASCGVGEPMRKVHVGYSTQIGITEDYSLKSKTTLKKVKAKSPCKISVFEYDATSQIEEEVTVALKELETVIDDEISAVSLKSEVEETWKLLWEPTDLEGYGFLELNPLGMSMGKIRYKGDTAYFNAILKAQPKVLSQPSNQNPSELPKLSTYKDRNGFDITMDIFTNYDSLSAILTREIKGQKLDLKGKEIIFGDISIHGAYNSQMNIKVDFSGDKSGTLYLTGTPVFDPEKQFISFPDLTFDINTKSALIKGAKWMFDKKITTMLREQAAMDLRPHLESMKKELDSSLNMELDEGVTMNGSITKIDIRTIQPLGEQLHIRIHSLGKLGITLD
ncbi:MAG: DUF4403 family protein [Crocinitomicaceae bacterium]|nr:DUF4403 family protein [Crocinitomicaceae bacterium]